MRTMYTVMFIFLALLIVFVLVVPKKTREPFQVVTGVTSIDIYKSANSAPEFLSEYDRKARLGLLDDRNNLLHMRGCYQVPASMNVIQELVNLSNSPAYRVNRLGPMYTNNFGEVLDRIREDIKSTCNALRSFKKDTNAKLEGQIYVMIFQAPYYQSQDGSMMSVQFNIAGYGMLPINIAGVGDVDTLRERPLDFDAFVIYANYRKNMDVRSTPYALDSLLASYRTKHEQCFLQCQGASSYICGCKTGDAPQQHYKSNCVTSRQNAQTIEEQNEAVPHNFPILYILNRAESSILGYVTETA